MSMLKFIPAILIIINVSVLASSQSIKFCKYLIDRDTSSIKLFEFVTDQDVFFKSTNMDRDYTMGVGLNFYNDWTDYNFLLVPAGRKLLDYVFLAEFGIKSRTQNADKFNRNYGLGITESAFTPYDLSLSNVDSMDRPYAAVFSLVSFNSKNTASPQMKYIPSIHYNRRSSFGIGTIGKFSSNIASFVQTGIHAGQLAIAKNKEDSIEVRPLPQGWRHAIGYNSNALTFQYNFTHELGFDYSFKVPCLGEKFGALKIEILGNAGFALGNIYRSFNTGYTIEIGLFGSASHGDFSGLRTLLPYILNLMPESIFTKSSKESSYQISFIYSDNFQYWFHNTLLQGGKFLSSEYYLQENLIQRKTSMLEYGFRLKILNLSGGFLKTIRSPVHRLNQNNQVWGKLFLRFDF